VAQTGKSASVLVKEAKAKIQNLTPAQVKAEMDSGNVVIIDIREPEELKQNGVIPGSVNAPRGMPEFYADPAMPCCMRSSRKTAGSFCIAPPADAPLWPW
jgi:hypothetical protein